MKDYEDEAFDELEKKLQKQVAVKPQIEYGCAECGVNGGHALYCVACAEKFVGGYKDSGVPAVETGLEQVSPDTPPQRTWVGLTDREKLNLWLESRAAIPRFYTYASLVEAKLKSKNDTY